MRDEIDQVSRYHVWNVPVGELRVGLVDGAASLTVIWPSTISRVAGERTDLLARGFASSAVAGRAVDDDQMEQLRAIWPRSRDDTRRCGKRTFFSRRRRECDIHYRGRCVA